MKCLQDATAALDISALYQRYPDLQIVESSVNPRLTPRADIVAMIPKGKVGAELGVFTGVFSEYLLRHAMPSKLYLVDPWHLAYGERFPPWGRYTNWGKLTTEAALEATKARTASYPAAEIVVARSLEWLATLPPAHLDWVYLDSSHRYDATLKELMAIAPKLTANGLIFGDDAWTERGNKHYGVFQAITDFCKIRPFELFRLDHAAQWAIRRQQQ